MLRRRLLLVIGFFWLLLAACAPAKPNPMPPPAVTAQEDGQEGAIEGQPVVVLETPSRVDGVNPPVNDNVLPENAVVVYEKQGNLWMHARTVTTQLTFGGADTGPKIVDAGRSALFTRNGELWMVDLKSMASRLLIQGTESIPYEYDYDAGSHKVYFSTMSLDGRPHWDLFVLNVTDGGVKLLLPPGNGGNFQSSPDWTILALVRKADIAAYNIKTGEIKPVYQYGTGAEKISYELKITWSTNNLGFYTVIPGKGGKVGRFVFIPATGGYMGQLAEFEIAPEKINASLISPDGSKVAYLKEKDGQHELHIVDASTADRLVISSPQEHIGILAWLPSSKGLVFWFAQPDSVWIFDGEAGYPLTGMTRNAKMRWLTDRVCVYFENSEMRWYSVNSDTELIDSGTGSQFDAFILQ